MFVKLDFDGEKLQWFEHIRQRNFNQNVFHNKSMLKLVIYYPVINTFWPDIQF